jgi:murein DD-endopeptidase MepM/ murein hydrolase activator NlpD
VRRVRFGAHVAAFVVILTVVPVTPLQASPSNLEATRREIRATRARLNSLVGDDRQVLATLNSITGKLRFHQSRLYMARARLTRIDLRIRSEERRLKRLATQRSERAEIIAARARALYMFGPVDGMQAVSQARSFSEFVDRAGAIEFVMAFDRSVLEDLATIQDETKKTRQALRAQRTEAAEVRNEVAGRVSIVGEIAAAKQDVHNRLSGRISAYRNELAALQREQARILNIIRSRSSRHSVSTGPVSTSGFAWPIRGRITSPYGPRWGGFHTGIDIDCRTGDPIGASKAGRVIASEWGGGYGNMVIIDHGNGVTTLYAHLSRRVVGHGQHVDQHQRVGACGATGNATGDHLHFEVRIDGQHRNPRNFLP